MRKVQVFSHDILAGFLEELENGSYRFTYLDTYQGPPVSLTMPITQKVYVYDSFPPFFEGLLPEGVLLEALLQIRKLDRQDYLGQLLAVGNDLVGAITVKGVV